MASLGERIVVLIDMDCFYCQVETKRQPEHKGKPLAVVQYNLWKGGGIIAVNYEARDHGVSRHMRGDEAKEKCPELILVSVPANRGKADTSRYRNAGREVIEVLKKHSTIVERASVDEAYLDITDIVEQQMSTFHMPPPKEMIQSLATTFIVGYSEVGKNDEEQRSKGVDSWVTTALGELGDIQSQKLAVAGILVEKMRADVFEKTGFRCSAGISYNKILAKLACGLHKPNRQTILPTAGVPSLFLTLPVKKVRNLGGKFGDVVTENLGCNVMADLLPFSLQDLQTRFDDKAGLWLYNIARGIDDEPVITRLVSKSIGSCKKFPGKQAIVSKEVLEHWVGQLASDVAERLEQDNEENERRATLLTVSFHYYQNNKAVSQSRSCPLTSYKVEKLAKQSVDIITKSTKHPIAFVGLSAGKFVQAKGSGSFMNFFKLKNQPDEDGTQCFDMTDRLEMDTISEPSTTSKASDLINNQNCSHSSVINATEDTTISLANTCRTEDVLLVTDCTKRFDEELMGNTDEPNEPKDQSIAFPVKFREPPNKSLNAKGTSLFDSSQNSPNDHSKLDNKCDSLLSEGVQDDIKNEVTNDASVSPLTKMNKGLHPDKFKKSFFMNIFNKSTTNKTSNSSQRKLPQSEIVNGEMETSGLSSDHNTTIDTKLVSNDECTRIQVEDDNIRSRNCFGGKSNEEVSQTKSTAESVNNESFTENKNSDWSNDSIEVRMNPSSSNCESGNRDKYTKQECDLRNHVEGSSSDYVTNKMNHSEFNTLNETPNNFNAESIPGSSVDTKRNETVEEDQTAMVQLQEIFPDLNNIDRSIVALLPPELQMKANLLLKARKENNTGSTEDSAKFQKPKSNKSKPNHSKSSVSANTNKINTFFKKTNAIDRSDIGPSEKCSLCNKLIKLDDYLEHVDFHVAMSLQREINSPLTDGTAIAKIKQSVGGSANKLEKRKRVKDEALTPDKKFKSITSFFS